MYTNGGGGGGLHKPLTLGQANYIYSLASATSSIYMWVGGNLVQCKVYPCTLSHPQTWCHNPSKLALGGEAEGHAGADAQL